ncbi:hypothetical protein TRVA0_046S00914 [Trichomonascus vanleenenianus]|uniref:cation diffusion facilitator family transporter n=1 Tax=Trichomonascus vanleenenianus TaxID=2268995 RepID=UPI003EC9F9F9
MSSEDGSDVGSAPRMGMQNPKNFHPCHSHDLEDHCAMGSEDKASNQGDTNTSSVGSLEARPIPYRLPSPSFYDTFASHSGSPMSAGVSTSHSHNLHTMLQYQQQGSPRDIEETFSLRFENLQEMRPYHLIGRSEPLADWRSLKKPESEMALIRRKAARRYYVRQNDLLDRYMEIDALLDSGISVSMLRVYGQDLREIHAPVDFRQGAPANIDTEGSPLISKNRQEDNSTVMLAIYVNFFVNFVLLVGKVIVALLTNSLSVLASLVDSVLDFLSTLIIWISARLVGQRDWKTKHLYPVGRNRLEPIGVLVFSVLMIVSFLQIANEAVQKLWSGDAPIVELGVWSMAIMTFTILAKVACWLWCRAMKSSAVQALAQDAVTDIVFNFFSMLFPLAGHWMQIWWFDPLGALILSCYVIYSWGLTALEHIDNLTGTAACTEDRQIILYTCMRFADSIRQITALNAYHTGDRITVEVDLVLDGDLSLKDSHDIGEALQYALETLPFVERAFVHLDYRTGNFTGHLDR